jgi:uncharacterized membrane protein
LITVTLYTRDDCHLCEQAHLDLKSLQSELPHRLVIIDVDGNKDLQRAYGFDVPVVETGPYRLKAPFDLTELRITLGAAQDRVQQLESLDIPKEKKSVQSKQSWTRADRFSYWFGRHYMMVLNLIVIFYLGLPFLAPVLTKVGAEGPANLIYRGYGLVCHQLAYRSFFLFGEQLVYPRAAAEVEGLYTYSEATGLGEESKVEDILTARRFIGNDNVGYKIALCQRDVAIYASILLFGVLFSLSGRRIPALPWYLWILIGMVPIALDGMSQLLSQPPFNFWDFRESTPYLRVLTGVLFGFTTAWFGYPLVEESMSDARRIMAAKQIRVQGDIKTKK